MKSCRLFLGYEVSDTANGVDLHLGATLGQLFAQAMDVDLDRIRGDIAGQSKNVIFDQFLGDDAILAAHQEFEHRRLARRQDLRFVIDECLAAFGVECEVRNLKRASEQLARTPQQRFQAGQQLLERKRLDEIVIGAAAQPSDAILQASTGGEHQNRQWILAPPYLSQDREAVAIGQAEVEHHGGVTGCRYRGLSLGRRRQDVGFIACCVETLGEELRELLVVLNQYQSHAQSIPINVTRLGPKNVSRKTIRCIAARIQL